MSKTSVANTGVLRDGNGKIDRESLPVATASQYGAVKASVAGGAEQAILGDANGKYNFGDDATLDPSCLNTGVIPSGVTIPASQVTGMPDSVSYATNAGHANSADNATRATTAGTADTATNATNAGHASTADSADSADEADKLSTTRRISVQMTVDGVQKGGYADFDGSGPITIDMGTVTTGGSGSADTSGLMPKPQSASGVGQTIRFGAVRGTGSAGATLPIGTLPNGGTWFIFGSHWVSDGTDTDNWQEFFDFAFAPGGTNIELITFNSGLSGGTSGNNMFTGLAIRIA